MKLKTTNTINKTNQTNKKGNREVLAYKLVFGKNDESKTYFDGRVCEHYKVPGLKTKIGVYKTIDEAMTQFRNLVFRKGTKTYNIIIDDETINEIKKEKTSFQCPQTNACRCLKNAFFHCNVNRRFLQVKTARVLIQKFPFILVHLAVSAVPLPAAGTGGQ